MMDAIPDATAAITETPITALAVVYLITRSTVVTGHRRAQKPYLVMVAVRRRRRLGQPKPPKKPPKWQATVDGMSPWFAMALAPALQPWVLLGAGTATVVEAKLSSAASFLSLFFYCAIASSSYLAMEIYTGLRSQRSQQFLARFRAWIDGHTDQAIVWAA